MRIATILFTASALALFGCGDDGGTSPGGTDAGDMTMTDAGTGGGDTDSGPLTPDGGWPDGGIVMDVNFCCEAGTGTVGGRMEGSDFELNCGIGEVVAGFEGYATTTRIWGVQLRCASLEPVMTEDGSISVTVGGAAAGTLVGTDAMGESVRSDCGVNNMATGVYGKADDNLVYSLGLTCGSGFVDDDGQILLNPESNSDFHGGAAGMGFDRKCPEGTLMTGIRGRASAEMGIIGIAANCAEAAVAN